MRESLISQVASALDRENAPFAVIGAAALATHGYPRSTADLDLLTTVTEVLRADWSGLLPDAVTATTRTGDADDPLRGVITFQAPGQDQVDLIVGRWKWQQEAIERSHATIVRGTSLPVVGLVDLVLLKIDAGGVLDLRDVDALVEIHGESLLETVATSLPEVSSLREGWGRYLDSRR